MLTIDSYFIFAVYPARWHGEGSSRMGGGRIFCINVNTSVFNMESSAHHVSSIHRIPTTAEKRCKGPILKVHVYHAHYPHRIATYSYHVYHHTQNVEGYRAPLILQQQTSNTQEKTTTTPHPSFTPKSEGWRVLVTLSRFLAPQLFLSILFSFVF